MENLEYYIYGRSVADISGERQKNFRANCDQHKHVYGHHQAIWRTTFATYCIEVLPYYLLFKPHYFAAARLKIPI